MRKALVAVTVMGLVAGFAATASATEVNVGGKITVTGTKVESDAASYYDTTTEVKVGVDAKISENLTAKVTIKADDDSDNGGSTNKWVEIDEGYFKLSNMFNTPLCGKFGYFGVNVGDSKIVDESLDAAMLGVKTDYGVAYAVVGEARADITTYVVGGFKGDLKPFGIGGAFEIADLYQDTMDKNVFYGKVAPEFEVDFGKVGVSVEGAVDDNGNFFGVGASLDNEMFGAKIAYDVYSDGFVSPLEDYDYAEVLDNSNFVNPAIITVEASVKPTDKVKLSAAYVNFDGDTPSPVQNNKYESESEIDLKASYKYTDNLKLSAGLYLPSAGVDYQAEVKVALSF
ncbi:hypothetical protein [Desulfurobacterium atlanticum]|uniref:Porin n=1 Tax=Desulfurobacterium atlanticum TaxID=240169 RepID=A0A238YPF5_9BACT|nr:hypothetical protein [Desulfurobacterium atlanticum]SNR72688.1 hypothetical protein SAMN06265340_10462 [Desulfurobacterium atlanticum]